VPVQKLLARELEGMEYRISKRKPMPVFEDYLVWWCKFARKYSLPCRHVFHLDSEVPSGVITAEKWREFISMFDECGFEVYESMGRVEVEERLVRPSERRVQTVLEMRELIEEMNQHMYDMLEVVDEENSGLKDDERQELLRTYMGLVRTSIRPAVISVPPVDMVGELRLEMRPWEL